MEIVGELHRTPGIMGVSHLTCFYAWIRLKAVLLTELLIVWRLWSQKSVVCSPSNLLKRQSSTSRPKLVACVIWDLLEHKPKFRTSCITLLYLRYESYANSVNDKNSLRKWLFGVGRVYLSRVFIKRVKLVPHAKPLQITDPFSHPIDWGRKKKYMIFYGLYLSLVGSQKNPFSIRRNPIIRNVEIILSWEKIINLSDSHLPSCNIKPNWNS